MIEVSRRPDLQTTAALAVCCNFADEYEVLCATGGMRSPIRDLTQMSRRTREALAQEGLSDIVRNLTIGDIEPRNFQFDGPPELARQLGLDFDSETRRLIVQRASEMQSRAWQTGEIVSGYQPEAVGLEALRRDYCDFINQYGFGYDVPDVMITSGSLPGIHAVLETYQATHDDQPIFLAPTPGFSLYFSQATRLGMEVHQISTPSETGFCVTADQINSSLDQHPNRPAILYLTPLNNPTSTAYDPETMNGAVSAFVQNTRDGLIVVDLAYLEMNEEKVAPLLSILQDPDVLDRTVLAMSMSKMFGYPRLRSAGIFTANRDMFRQLQTNAQIVYASQSGEMEYTASAYWRTIPKNARLEMYELFRMRQRALLNTLAEVNQTAGEPLVDVSEAYTQVPMYVYARLAPGITPLELFRRTGICGVPGEVFGDTQNRIRFSVGMEPFPPDNS